MVVTKTFARILSELLSNQKIIANTRYVLIIKNTNPNFGT